MLVEVHPDDEEPWAVLFANEAWEQTMGLARPRDGGRLPFWEAFAVRQEREGGMGGREGGGWGQAVR